MSSLCAIAVIVSLAACGGSDSTASPATTGGAEYEIVTDAQVTAGLADVTQVMSTLSGLLAQDQDQARAAIETMYTRWFEFEGTIRANDKNLYLDMEDGLVAAKIGVQENRPNKIDEGVAAFAAATSAYLLVHP